MFISHLLGSVLSSLFQPERECKKSTLLPVVMLASGISLVLFEVFFSLAIYRLLIDLYLLPTSLALLASGGIFLLQALLLTAWARCLLKKTTSKEIIGDNYKAAKRTILAFVHGL